MSFEILCVTMHQTDFSKIEAMNIHSDVVFANQADCTAYEEYEFDGHRAKMITTATRGVGVNRNLGLLYASADICLFADDDVRYVDDMEARVLAEFEAHSDADIIIFHLDSDDDAYRQRQYKKTLRHRRFERMPWGAIRIAFRSSAVKQANLWFTTLFGGGCIFPSGEDSMWLTDAKRAGLRFYVSKETIGTVSFAESTWFTGYNERFYFGKGAYHQAMHPKTFWLWKQYVLFRFRNHKQLSQREKLRWMNLGRRGYLEMKGYGDYAKHNN